MQKAVSINRPKKANFAVRSFNINNYASSTIIMLCFMGFLLSRAIIVDSIAPLGVAFYLYICKVKKYNIPVFIGVMLGTMLSFNQPSYIIKYAICITIIFVFSSVIRKINSITKVAAIGLAMLILSSILQVVLIDIYIYDIIVALFEGIIVFASIYIYSYGVPLIIKRDRRENVSNEELVALSLVVIFSIVGIGSISLFGISIQNIFSIMLVIILAYAGGPTFGASTGLMVGLISSMSNSTTSIYIGIYALAGLLAGAFRNINKYLCIIGYIIGWISMVAYTGAMDINIMNLREILIASIMVLLIPDNILSYIDRFTKISIGSYHGAQEHVNRVKEITNSRLVSMYKTYDELANTFDKIREKDKIINQRDIASIVDMIHNDECKHCGMKRRCWEMKFNYTYTMISNLLGNLEEQGRLEEDSIPIDFKKSCIKPESIVKTANYYYKLFALDYNWKQRLSETRKLISRQIRCISSSIEGLADDLQEGLTFDLEKESNILVELDRNNISLNNIQYLRKDNDDFEIIINKKTCKDCSLCDKKLINIVSDIVECDLTAQKFGCNSLSNECKITLTRAQEYKAMTQEASMSKDGHILCGDNYTYMEISDGKYMAAISDGMGKGQKAYEESSVTIDILEKMMECKISEEITIDTINNMLILKSSDEMFSTLDLSLIDLKRGILDTVKMGSCPTYIKRSNGEVDLIASSSLPVGILSDVQVHRDNTRIKDGDYIIMISDGIVDAGKNNNLGDNWLLYFIKNIDSTNPREISKQILNKALDIQEGNIEDDMTVLVTKIYKN